MKAGRNDPCPCGSGKKYKKCCLPRHKEQQSGPRLEPPPQPRAEWEEEAVDASEVSEWPDEPLRPELTAALSAEPDQPVDAVCPDKPTPKPQPDPFREAMDSLWNEFQACDYEGQTALFLKTLDTPELLSKGMAIELLDAILRGAKQQDDWDRFEILIRAFRERLPETFAESAACCISWLIEGKVARGRLDDLAPLAREIAAYAGDDIDIFNLALDSLAYHCELSTLVDVMRTGWPGVKDSHNVISWGVEEFVDRAFRYEMLQYCEQALPPRPDDPALIERLEFYVQSVKEEFVTGFIRSVVGPAQQGAVAGGSRSEWCARLRLEFLGHLLRECRWTPGKADLAVENLCRYLVERLNGRLDHVPPLYNPGERPVRRKGKSRRTQRRAVHVLCPDAGTLDPYLARQIGFLSSQHHAVAATMESIPAWLRFLEMRQWIDSQEHIGALRDLARLHADLLKLWKDYRDDPSLHEAADRAWQEPQPNPQTTC